MSLYDSSDESVQSESHPLMHMYAASPDIDRMEIYNYRTNVSPLKMPNILYICLGSVIVLNITTIGLIIGFHFIS